MRPLNAAPVYVRLLVTCMDFKDSGIRKFHRRFHFNIGIFVFALVLVYFAFHLIRYVTQDDTVAYEVQYGEITENSTYTGLILRNETVVNASLSGTINYYVKQGDKAASGDQICSIDETGSIAEQITEAGYDTSSLSDADLEEIEDTIAAYRSAYSSGSFSDVYTLKSTLNDLIQENLYLNALSQLADSQLTSDTFSFETAPESGIVVYATDGYEELTTDSFQPEDYAPTGYTQENLKDHKTVSAGDAIYTLVTDEDWYMLVPISDEERESYEEISVLSVIFTSDEKSVYATVEVLDYDEGSYLLLTFNTAVVRYAAERYTEVILDVETSTGLKIPNSSITYMECLRIPVSYITEDEDGNQGVLLMNSRTTDSEFVEIEVVRANKKYYIVKQNGLTQGDVIRKPESSTQYSLDTVRKVPGVYDITRGYAVFRFVKILAQNQDYAVIDDDNDYSIDIYDRIALNASGIEDGEIIH